MGHLDKTYLLIVRGGILGLLQGFFEKMFKPEECLGLLVEACGSLQSRLDLCDAHDWLIPQSVSLSLAIQKKTNDGQISFHFIILLQIKIKK